MNTQKWHGKYLQLGTSNLFIHLIFSFFKSGNIRLQRALSSLLAQESDFKVIQNGRTAEKKSDHGHGGDDLEVKPINIPMLPSLNDQGTKNEHHPRRQDVRWLSLHGCSRKQLQCCTSYIYASCFLSNQPVEQLPYLFFTMNI